MRACVRAGMRACMLMSLHLCTYIYLCLSEFPLVRLYARMRRYASVFDKMERGEVELL